MDWTGHVIWWHCYPLGFVNAEDTAVHEVRHRLGQLTNWLDYLLDLGCNGMLLNPIFASSTHGYDTLDHYAIDSRLGDDGDFGELMWKAKERGIRILLDGVFNHLGRAHPIVQRALTAGPGTPADAGVSIPVVRAAIEAGSPLLGVCLGHQAIAEALGATVTHADELMHGKTSLIRHDDSAFFDGVELSLVDWLRQNSFFNSRYKRRAAGDKSE